MTALGGAVNHYVVSGQVADRVGGTVATAGVGAGLHDYRRIMVVIAMDR